MFNIRRSLFETNSSSTHSISLSKPLPEKRDDIPKHTKIFIEPYDQPACRYDDESIEILAYRTQMAKLRYLMHVIVSILHEDVPEKYLTEFKDKIDDWRYTPTKEEKEKYAEAFFALPQFKWLSEAIYEKTGSVSCIKYDVEDEFPFWQTIYDDNIGLLEVFEFDNKSWNDKDTFKAKVSRFIFDESVVIYDKNIPYGCSEDTEIQEF